MLAGPRQMPSLQPLRQFYASDGMCLWQNAQGDSQRFGSPQGAIAQHLALAAVRLLPTLTTFPLSRLLLENP